MGRKALQPLTWDVEIDKRAVQGYHDQDDKGRTSEAVTKYIEAVYGKEFLCVESLKLFKPKQNTVTVGVYMDGQHCNDRLTQQIEIAQRWQKRRWPLMDLNA